MTNYETLQKICERAKENIDLLNTSGKLDALSKCIAFADDLHKWVSYCDNVKDYILVKEAQTECINSIYMCAQGFYKEAITTLRQFFEHMLFAILLSTNDYKYRLWQTGRYDMSWSQIVDDQNGIFGKQFDNFMILSIARDSVSISKIIFLMRMISLSLNKILLITLRVSVEILNSILLIVRKTQLQEARIINCNRILILRDEEMPFRYRTVHLKKPFLQLL